MPCVAKRVYPKAIDELPEWLRGLKGYDVHRSCTPRRRRK